ncbi:substrate-binding domain-containing protein [Aureimonas frigidaquae]|uniref:ABC transporter substrate-binding protein n=1 Tax=Aureimonas frigidaquae TaxID=424757 RepID=A0A0P0Z437_9HYPH|nr:substrate-binding domain-containing protein [Aureimonas frigidaquae]BAT28831.1 ABC transporter substrate-binding protein [Aureimonas frigidaquae]
MKLAALVGALAGATMMTSAAMAQESCSVGISMYTLGAPYFAAQEVAARQAAEAAGCTVRSADGQNDMVKQIGDIEDMVASGVNVLIVNPRDSLGLVPAVNAATAEGVHVVAMDSMLDPSADFITNVSASNEANGKLVGAWLAQKMGNTPLKIALISGSQGNVVGQARRLGVLTGLMDALLTNNGSANVQIVGQGWGNWATEGGLNAMEDLLTAHPDINVVLGENDSMVIGAREALKAANRLDGVLLVAAADGQKEAYQLIKNGEYGATGLNDPAALAKMAVDIGVKALNGEEQNLTKFTFTDPAAVTQENVDQYYKQDSMF